MAVTDWDWRYPVELQDVPWDCAAASCSWAMRACGHNWSESDVVRGLGPERISPTYGLLDASGAGLVSFLAEVGIGAMNDADASWEEVVAAAGHQPMLIGGRKWNHWSGVRLGGGVLELPNFPFIALANPSPGWGEVEQVMSQGMFGFLGTFSAVWFTSW
jgi:hypothetical protein